MGGAHLWLDDDLPQYCEEAGEAKGGAHRHEHHSSHGDQVVEEGNLVQPCGGRLEGKDRRVQMVVTGESGGRGMQVKESGKR